MRAEFGLACEDTKIGSLVILLLGPRDLGLDVERKRLDRAGEIAVIALGEGADGRHDKSPCLNSGRAHRGLDGDQEAEGDQPAPLAAVAQRRMVGGRLSCFARNALAQGKKVDGPPLREGDRGKANPRPDQPIRGRVGARTDREETWRPFGRFPQGGSSVRGGIKCTFALTAAKRRADSDRLLPHLRGQAESASWKKTPNARRG
jgi:hypothetical protein